MELTDIRGLPDKELLEKALEIRQRVFNLKFKAQTEPVTNPAEVRDLKKTVARIHTVIAERARAGKPASTTGGPREKRLARRASARSVAAAAAKEKALRAARAKAAAPKQAQAKAAKAGAKRG
jgi:large subunit ribosomal protein L29